MARRHSLAVVLTGALLAGCVAPYGMPATGDLHGARLACNAQYPRRIGNYAPHAECVNAAVEQYALPGARYPDLVRLQAQVRAVLSQKIDRHQIAFRSGEERMRHADAMVAAAERDRDAGRETAARRNIAALEAMLR